MTAPNDYPASPESYPNQEVVQYRDETALRFRIPGDRLELGGDTSPKFARDFSEDGRDMALIVTTGGDVYGLAGGVIVDFSEQIGRVLPPMTIVIGGKWAHDNSSDPTSVVDRVACRYKAGQ